MSDNVYYGASSPHNKDRSVHRVAYLGKLYQYLEEQLFPSPKDAAHVFAVLDDEDNLQNKISFAKVKRGTFTLANVGAIFEFEHDGESVWWLHTELKGNWKHAQAAQINARAQSREISRYNDNRRARKLPWAVEEALDVLANSIVEGETLFSIRKSNILDYYHSEMRLRASAMREAQLKKGAK